MREVKLGDHVMYITSMRERVNAIVQCIHGTQTENYIPCINLVVLSQDPNKTDSYGRQIEHETSVNHVSTSQKVFGCMWYWPDEEVVIAEDEVATQR